MQWAIGDGIRIGCVLIALNCPPGLLLDKQTKGIVPWSEQLNKRSTLNTAMYQVELPGPPLPKKLAQFKNISVTYLRDENCLYFFYQIYIVFNYCLSLPFGFIFINLFFRTCFQVFVSA